MSNETIFREVDEELRGDRLRNLWRRFGPYVIGAAVAIVLLVAVNEGWSWWQGSQAAAASDKFYAALEIADGQLRSKSLVVDTAEGRASGTVRLDLSVLALDSLWRLEAKPPDPGAAGRPSSTSSST